MITMEYRAHRDSTLLRGGTMSAGLASSRRLRGASVAAWIVLAGAFLTACTADVSPESASPFTPVTVDDGGFCESDEDTAVASSEAFIQPVTLDREDNGTLDGTATVANVPEGTYGVDVTCEDGRITRSNIHVDAMPKGADTGVGPDGMNALQWVAGIVLVAGLATLGYAITRRRANVRPGG
jgi:hypothetical protein